MLCRHNAADISGQCAYLVAQFFYEFRVVARCLNRYAVKYSAVCWTGVLNKNLKPQVERRRFLVFHQRLCALANLLNSNDVIF